MSDAEEYIRKIAEMDKARFESWRQLGIRMLIFFGGGLFLMKGCIEVAIVDGNLMSGIFYIIIGLLGILFILKPRGERRGR